MIQSFDIVHAGYSQLHPDCEECRRLWQEYSLAITTHIRLEYRLRDAAIGNDLSQVQSVAEEADRAEMMRANLREAIRNHEDKAHGEKKPAAAQ